MGWLTVAGDYDVNHELGQLQLMRCKDRITLLHWMTLHLFVQAPAPPFLGSSLVGDVPLEQFLGLEFGTSRNLRSDSMSTQLGKSLIIKIEVQIV